jgi:thioesterase DpgC
MAIAEVDLSMLVATGLARDDVDRWASSEPGFDGGVWTADARSLSSYLLPGQALIDRLPPRPERAEREQTAAETIIAGMRAARVGFLRRHAAALYDQITDARRRFVRIEELVYRAADLVPGLCPTRDQVSAERQHPQKDKEGHEVDQGLLLSYVLTNPSSGGHLVHAMRRPRAESLELVPEFERTGRVEIGATTVERRDGVGYLYHGNPRFLNAEDDTTTSTLEIGTDLILLDPHIDVGVMRGKPVDHTKYAGRRVFNAGINLTHLYHGQISFVDFFIVRDMGYLHKMFRGLSGPEYWPDEVETGLEKPWIAAVETFAIGGGCQLLLAMDHVLAERSSFFNLPARKEGIIPGVSNMRLWRFVGDRAARQAILFERQFQADSAAGRLIADTVVEDGSMDTALSAVLDGLRSSGVVSAAGNRKAMRIGQESLEQFRQYMALYCREQAYCHYSPQLIANLERNWRAHERRL